MPSLNPIIGLYYNPIEPNWGTYEIKYVSIKVIEIKPT